MKKELNELLKAVGYVADEVHEITSDGFSLDDLKSVKDLIVNKDLLIEGFTGLKEMSVKDMDLADMTAALLSIQAGFALGAK